MWQIALLRQTALSPTEICIEGFSQSPYAENNSYSSNSIQAVGLVWWFLFVWVGLFVGWFGFFSKMWNSGFGLSTSSESITFLFPLETTVDLDWNTQKYKVVVQLSPTQEMLLFWQYAYAAFSYRTWFFVLIT